MNFFFILLIWKIIFLIISGKKNTQEGKIDNNCWSLLLSEGHSILAQKWPKDLEKVLVGKCHGRKYYLTSFWQKLTVYVKSIFAKRNIQCMHFSTKTFPFVETTICLSEWKPDKSRLSYACNRDFYLSASFFFYFFFL